MVSLPSASFWNGRRVFLTGHTGFKGSWTSIWLHRLGAQVTGYALAPPTNPNMFDAAGVETLVEAHHVGDIRDAATLRAAMIEAAPEIILHMAAQPLVRLSYAQPVETFETNVMGTVNVLEAARQVPDLRAIVSVTTDKCYENREWQWSYRENDPLGGHDPYSASKACAEIVTAAYRSSFARECDVAIATARAGNVIGGGDWALDRLIPDSIAAWDDGRTTLIRRPGAVRPWQHVLEPVCGYLMLAEALVSRPAEAVAAWNFGPADTDNQPVGYIQDRLAALLPGYTWRQDGADSAHEAGLLKLDSSRARALLGWQSRWSLDEALARTVEWHRAWRDGRNVLDVTLAQIDAYGGPRG
ncbi:CDP-glucose 4,6-dehydratase [Sphingomonas sp. M1-B02]|uniref:CDP-glucose 4,6-dehydratase n=1 Tax=Sphingomonas sp. M1-B02 TaxID=3114300 RepID=UPI0022404DC7|nr:CDP-glucose 4,6-dehydratase [Sphingomonas sp. S6-11]UZK65057.1 CDP-glucose 4,6-dehydratase [Sphingomonas sp. S6-11]